MLTEINRYACMKEHEDIYSKLLELGTNINKGDLFIACIEGNISKIKNIVKLGVDINKEDSKGCNMSI